MSRRDIQRMAHNAPLHNQDTKDQTFGCRHTNPDICNAAYLPDVCAFVRDDNLCHRPGRGWQNKYNELLRQGDCKNDG